MFTRAVRQELLRIFDKMEHPHFAAAKAIQPKWDGSTTAWVEKAPEAIGVLTLVTLTQKGSIHEVRSGKNIVVKTGRKALAHLCAGDDVANQKVGFMRFGDGTGTPNVADTGLFGSAITMTGGLDYKPVVVDFPDSGGDDMKVRFTATVNADEGNGSGTQVYREAVLLKGTGVPGDLFSHKVSGDITKDDSVVLVAAWTYIY